MDPTYISDTPGKSPMGMDLVPVYEEEEDVSADETTGGSEIYYTWLNIADLREWTIVDFKNQKEFRGHNLA